MTIVLKSATLEAERDAMLAALGPRPSWWRPILRRRWDRRYVLIMNRDVSAMAEWLRSVYGKEAIQMLARQSTVAFTDVVKKASS